MTWPPSLRAPLWPLFDEDGHNDPAATPVVGIVIEYHADKKLLVATEIAEGPRADTLREAHGFLVE